MRLRCRAADSGCQARSFSALFVGRGDETGAILGGPVFSIVSVPSSLGGVMRPGCRRRAPAPPAKGFSALFVGRGDETLREVGRIGSQVGVSVDRKSTRL